MIKLGEEKVEELSVLSRLILVWSLINFYIYLWDRNVGYDLPEDQFVFGMREESESDLPGSFLTKHGFKREGS